MNKRVEINYLPEIKGGLKAWKDKGIPYNVLSGIYSEMTPGGEKEHHKKRESTFQFYKFDNKFNHDL